MGTIAKPNTFTANTTASASQVNDNFDTIYNEFNGNISAANLATGAVTTTKIADNAVTGDKILVTELKDSSDNEYIKFSETASAVNEVTVTNAATGNAPSISATGGDTDIDLKLTPKGTGKVITPFIGARAYRSAAFNVTGGGGQEKISLDAESYDPQSAFDTSNGRYVAPITGYYRVYAQIGLSDVADASQLLVLIYVNGATTSVSRTVSSAATLDPTAVAYDIVYATAGQYIEMYADCTTTEPVNTGAETTYMAIEFAGI